MLTGCDTALPVEGDRMSSPPPISVMSCTGVQSLDLTSCSVRAGKYQMQLHFCQEGQPVEAPPEYKSTGQSDAATAFFNALAMRVVGAPGCRSPGWLRSAA